MLTTFSSLHARGSLSLFHHCVWLATDICRLYSTLCSVKMFLLSGPEYPWLAFLLIWLYHLSCFFSNHGNMQIIGVHDSGLIILLLTYGWLGMESYCVYSSISVAWWAQYEARCCSGVACSSIKHCVTLPLSDHADHQIRCLSLTFLIIKPSRVTSYNLSFDYIKLFFIIWSYSFCKM